MVAHAHARKMRRVQSAPANLCAMSHAPRRAASDAKTPPPVVWAASACSEDTCCELVTCAVDLEAPEELAIGVALSRALAGEDVRAVVREVLVRAFVSFLTHHLFAWLLTEARELAARAPLLLPLPPH